MAEPARKYDPEYNPDPRFDPTIPAQPPLSDPAPPETLEPLSQDDLVEENYAAPRTAGSGVIIAAIVVVLAALAFYFFAPGASETTAPPAGQPATTQPAQTQ